MEASYTTYLVHIKNGAASVAVAVDGEEEAPGQNDLPSRPRGHEATNTNLKREALALALSETLQKMMADTQDAMPKMDEKRRREKEKDATMPSSSTSPSSP
jgi:hypothetical protein